MITHEAVLFHTHGIGPFDFSSIEADDLVRVNGLATDRSALLCPTVYLAEGAVPWFGHLIRSFHAMKEVGQLERIIGFAIEGPVLGPKGGTPAGTVWAPTETQWREIATWFSFGLKYIVVSPDMLSLDQEIGEDFTFGDLLLLIYESGGRIAIGHFEGRSPITSAERLQEVLDHIERYFERSPYLVLTDHLFNDMPRAFKHAFRTVEERAGRDVELVRHAGAAWQSACLSELLGPVPAAILGAAQCGRLTPALNFDGGHVDLEFCKMVVDLLGPDRVIAITDHTETSSLAGELLSVDPLTRLLYRGDGILAASSVAHEEQLINMRSIGMAPGAIASAFFETPLNALLYAPRERGKATTG